MTVTKNVSAVRQNDQGAWIVDYDNASGHGFPLEALACRAAEYGVDPTDTDTLLEILLHEPHVGVDQSDPTFVYNTDRDTARKAHLARVAASPVRVKDPHGHLDALRAAHLAAHDPDRHAALMAQVDTIRFGRGVRPMRRL